MCRREHRHNSAIRGPYRGAEHPYLPRQGETDTMTAEESTEVIDSVRVRRMVFATRDFPHGLWFKGRGSIHPSGTYAEPSSLAREAGNAGSWSAMRLFIQLRGRRTAQFWVHTYLTAADAAKGVRIETVANARFNPRSRFRHSPAPYPHHGVHIPGADKALALEWDVVGPKGVGTDRFGVFMVGRVLVHVNLLSWYADTWPWDEVIDLCGRQADKVNRVLAAN